MVKPSVLVVSVMLRDADDRIMLFERVGTETFPGLFCCPGGRVEPGEDLRTAAIREMLEETGLTIEAKDLKFVSVIDRLAFDGEARLLVVFFETRVWSGEPRSRESDKHGMLEWYALDALPEKLSLSEKAIIQHNFQPDVILV